jgi:uncharacterized protein YodC (DUF2158 family)
MEVGDVVRLKSGGPRMTIASIDVVFARCSFFDGFNMREAVLRLACLEVEPRGDENEVARRERELQEAGAAGARIVPAETTGLGLARDMLARQAARMELKAATEAEELAVATGGDVVAAVQRRLRAEEFEARVCDEPGTF